VASLGSAITSPAKLAYVAYCLLAYSGVLGQPTLWEFLSITGLFIGLQILHDDHWRIRLNERAKLNAAIEREAAGFDKDYEPENASRSNSN